MNLLHNENAFVVYELYFDPDAQNILEIYYMCI